MGDRILTDWNTFFGYTDILDHIIEYLLISDIKNLSTTHSCFRDNTKKSLFTTAIVKTSDLNSLCESGILKHIINLKISIHEEKSFDTTRETFWQSLPNLKSVTILGQYSDKFDEVVASYDLLARLDKFFVEHVETFILPEVLPSTLQHLVLYGCEVQNPLSLSTCQHSLTWTSFQLNSLPRLHDSLSYLDISFNGLLNVSNLPRSLRHLDCSNNQIESLPESLPPGLLFLDCSHNSLSSITCLPPNLEKLNCDDNFLKSISSLPLSLSWFSCKGNYLSDVFSESGILPLSLKVFICSRNGLKVIPIPLPPGLLHLDCSHNDISSIPCLPSSLEELKCNRNNIRCLPMLPPSLTILSCGLNELMFLPSLPNTLRILDCDFNPLTELPALPDKLQQLYFFGNQITNLPPLPKSLRKITDPPNRWPELPSGCTTSNTSEYKWKHVVEREI